MFSTDLFTELTEGGLEMKFWLSIAGAEEEAVARDLLPLACPCSSPKEPAQNVPKCFFSVQ